MTDQEQKDAEFKTKYNYVFKASNTDADGVERVAYFRTPNRMVIGIAMAEIERNVLNACEYIFDDAVIREISDVDYFRNNTDVFVGLNVMLQSLIRVKKSSFQT